MAVNPRSLAQGAKTVAKIAAEILDPPNAAYVPAFLADLLDPAELSPRPPASFVFRESLRNVLARLQFQVSIELLTQFPFSAPWPQQSAYAKNQILHHGYASSNTLPIATLNCSQVFVSTCNCLRPEEVNR